MSASIAFGQISPAPIVAARPDADAHREEQEDGDGGIARQIVEMSDAARLPAEAGELTVRMVEEIGDDHQQGGDVGPTVRALHERGCARKAHREADRRQMIRGDAAGGERCHQGSRQPRVPGTLRAPAECQYGIRHHRVRLRAPLRILYCIVPAIGASSSRLRRATVQAL